MPGLGFANTSGRVSHLSTSQGVAVASPGTLAAWRAKHLSLMIKPGRWTCVLRAVLLSTCQQPSPPGSGCYLARCALVQWMYILHALVFRAAYALLLQPLPAGPVSSSVRQGLVRVAATFLRQLSAVSPSQLRLGRAVLVSHEYLPYGCSPMDAALAIPCSTALLSVPLSFVCSVFSWRCVWPLPPAWPLPSHLLS